MTTDASQLAQGGKRLASAVAGEDDARERALWEALHNTGAVDARAQLFIHYQPLARRIALRQHRAQGRADVDLPDILQMAHMGLLEAIDHFNPARRVPFKYYGNRRILGCVLDGLARMTELRAQASSRQAARQDRLRSLKAGRQHETAGSLDQALAKLGAIANELAIGFMLEDSGFLSDPNAAAQDTPYDSLVWRQMERRLASELALLAVDERAVLTYHYLGAISFTRIAELLALSTGRISQIHKSALGKLRKRLLRSGIGLNES